MKFLHVLKLLSKFSSLPLRPAQQPVCCAIDQKNRQTFLPWKYSCNNFRLHSVILWKIFPKGITLLMKPVLSQQQIQRRAAAYTSGIIGLLFAFLFLFHFSGIPPLEGTSEGLEVNLGFEETGSGEADAAPAAGDQPSELPAVDPNSPPPTPQNAAAAPSNDLQQENGEEADIVAKALERRQKELDRQKQDQDRLAQQEEERKRLLAEERQKQMEEARNRARTARANSRGGQGGNGPGGQGTAGSQGVAGGEGNQGNPNGNPNSNNYNGDGSGNGAAGTGMGNVAGRQYRGGPSVETNVQVEGVVTVKIWVDNDGKVLRVRGGVPLTTITDRNIWKLCENNAKRHIFSANPNDEAEKEGTITYRFKLQ
jgi:outer membrane biosynthesis protein TonB